MLYALTLIVLNAHTLAAIATPGRGLSQSLIAGYPPNSDVIEHNKIDLDQKAMEDALADYDFAAAKKWYAEGGNSISKGKFRTIKGFSTAAKTKMYDGCIGCPYADYLMYYKYYGDHDYADKWVTAALDGSSTDFRNGHQQNFALGTSKDAKDVRVEAAKKGSAYMNIYMYVIREFEDAIDDCKAGCIDCNDAPVHAWDEGVAFYTGSLEGTDGAGDGVLLYALADKRCQNFKTCGMKGNKDTGTSQVNYELGRLFSLGQHYLLVGECQEAKAVKEQVVNLMAVPLIQGTLRYAYKIDKLNGGTNNKENAEGAVFAAAVLPRVAHCDAEAAGSIEANMKLGAKASFATVKMAFERAYACMNVTCSSVGGLWFPGKEDYYEGAAPCYKFETDISVGGLVGIVVAGVVLLLAFLLICYMARREKAGNPIFYAVDQESSTKSTPPQKA